MPIISGSVVSLKFVYDLFPSGFVHNVIVVQQCACPHWELICTKAFGFPLSVKRTCNLQEWLSESSSKFLTLEKYQNSLRLCFLKSGSLDYIIQLRIMRTSAVSNLDRVKLELLTPKIRSRSHLSMNILPEFPGHFFLIFRVLRYRILY